MAATVYLFLLTLAFASGTFLTIDQNGWPTKIQPKLSYQRTNHFRYPKLAISPQRFLEECRLRHPYTFKCYQELDNIFRRIREDPKPEPERNTFNANTRNLLPRILNENKKQIDKSESYINSILDEDKRDASNINASDNVLNSTWIEIKDPRKTVIPIKSEIGNGEETDEFVSFRKGNIINGEKADSSFIENKENKTNRAETDGSNTDGDTTTEMQQTTTITEPTDVITSRLISEMTIITGETSDVNLTKEVTGGITTAKQDPIFTVEIDQENKGNTNVQKKTTGVSSSENVEKSTTTDLHTDSGKFGFKKTIENTTVNETDIEVTTGKITEDKFSSVENMPSESQSISTSVVPEDLNNDTTLATGDFTKSTVFETTVLTHPTKSESVFVSDADISPSSKTKPATSSSPVIIPSVTESFGYKTESSDGGFTSTMITKWKSSNGDYATKSIPVVSEHTINIRSIKIAKTVLSVLLLVTGLIAVVMLAVYFFKVRRGAVQYDQLTLLP